MEITIVESSTMSEGKAIMILSPNDYKKYSENCKNLKIIENLVFDETPNNTPPPTEIPEHYSAGC